MKHNSQHPVVHHGLSAWKHFTHFNSDNKPSQTPHGSSWWAKTTKSQVELRGSENPNAVKLEKKPNAPNFSPILLWTHFFHSTDATASLYHSIHSDPFVQKRQTEVLQDAQCGAEGNYSGFQDFMMQILQETYLGHWTGKLMETIARYWSKILDEFWLLLWKVSILVCFSIIF